MRPPSWLLPLPFAALLFACTSNTAPPAGSVAENGNCNADAECARPAGKELSCLCAPGSTSTHAQCVALLTEGAGCAPTGSFQTPCASGLYCTFNSGGAPASTCVRYAERGEDCSNRVCDLGLACGANRKCGDPLAAGSACSYDRDCAGDAVCAMFKCAAPAAVGQSCFGFTPKPDNKDGDRNPCVAGAVCSNGTCAQAKPDGAACGFSDECASGLCMMSGPGTGKCETTAPGTAEKMCFRQ